MSAVALRLDDAPASLPVAVLLDTLAALNVSFTRRGEGLALTNAAVLTAELRDSVREHKPELLALCDLRAGFTRLTEYAIRLRCEDPKKGTRAGALHYQARQIEKLAALALESGLALGETDEDGNPLRIMGFSDPADPFGGDQFRVLRRDLAELAREDAPYPLPLPAGCVLLPEANFDPFEHGRLYNGMMSGG